jgi:hypothetical protein
MGMPSAFPSGQSRPSSVCQSKRKNHEAIQELIRAIVGADVLTCAMTKVAYRVPGDDKPEMAEAYLRFRKDHCKRVFSQAGRKGVVLELVGDHPFEVIITPLKKTSSMQEACKSAGTSELLNLGVVVLKTGFGVRVPPAEEASVQKALYPDGPIMALVRQRSAPIGSSDQPQQECQLIELSIACYSIIGPSKFLTTSLPLN